jgi:anti-sigma factor RsiW
VTCRQVVELMTDYLEGALSAADRGRFEAHLSGCDGCTEYLRQLRTSMALARRLGEEPIPAALEAELVKAFRDWKAS